MWLCVLLLLASSGILFSPIEATVKFDGKLRQSADGSTEAYMIPPYPSNHASTLELLPDGSLVAAWFSGEKEEAPGCAIVVARLPAGADGWTSAETVSRDKKYSMQNPVLFNDNKGGALHLFHSHAPAESGESQSTIWHLVSSDSGKNWTTPNEWLSAPGGFPRNRIIPAPNGGVLFPFYNASSSPEFDGHNYAIMGISDAARSLDSSSKWKFVPIPGSGDLVQPSTVQVGTNESLITFFRDRRSENIYRATADPTGHEWSKPDTSANLPNNNAGIEANVIKPSNRIVIAYNPTTHWRDPLEIALSDDGGQSWPYKRYLQYGDSDASDAQVVHNEFSYPSVLVTYNSTGSAIIHVTYTYNRDTIKYKRFTEQWVIDGDSPTGNWICKKEMDATGKTPGKFKLAGTTAGVEECQAICDGEGPDNCVVFDWNAHSGHCYIRFDGVWELAHNDHVTSCCLSSRVKNCTK
jgi:predicted neuraminidase